MSIPSLRALRAFAEVARAGSLVQAARSLHVSPSAVSHLLRDLEAALGFALFAGRGPGAPLSEPGARLARRLGGAFDAIDLRGGRGAPPQRRRARLRADQLLHAVAGAAARPPAGAAPRHAAAAGDRHAAGGPGRRAVRVRDPLGPRRLAGPGRHAAVPRAPGLGGESASAGRAWSVAALPRLAARTREDGLAVGRRGARAWPTPRRC